MPNSTFDAYHRWLGIPPKYQPPDYYRLLALERLEDDEEVIRDAAEQRIAHVRNYRLGDHGELAHQLLNELGRAKATLLDPEKKAAYDVRLRENATRQPVSIDLSPTSSSDGEIADFVPEAADVFPDVGGQEHGSSIRQKIAKSSHAAVEPRASFAEWIARPFSSQRGRMLAVGTCVVAVLFALLFVLVRLRSPAGIVEVVLDEGVSGDIEVVLLRDGERAGVITGKSDWSTRLAEGKYDVWLAGNAANSLRLSVDRIVVQGEDKSVIRVLRRPEPSVAIRSQTLSSEAKDKQNRPSHVPNTAIEFGGHWYEFIEQQLSFDEAVALAERKKGRLLIVESAEENSFIWERIKDKDAVWLGIRKDQIRWTDENRMPLQFSNWDLGQGVLTNDREPYAALSYLDGKWHDNPASRRFHVCIEWADQFAETLSGLAFDGEESYLVIPSLKYDGSHPITIEAVVTPFDARYSAVFASCQNAGMGLNIEKGRWNFVFHDKYRYHFASSDEPPRIGRKIHLAGVYTGSELMLFVDGALQSRVVKGITTHKISPFCYMIGADPDESGKLQHPFRGLIHSARVSKGARYTSDFQPEREFTADSRTIILYRFDERVGGTAFDASGNGHNAEIHNAKWLRVSRDRTKTSIVNSLGMKFRLIPAGEFMMGSNESAVPSDERPQHRVRVRRDFYLGTTEVTQSQWRVVMGTTPWSGNNHVKEGPDYPATYVNWDDAVEFCRRLSAKEGVTYRLPSEAEWEYACRAGSTTIYSFGDDESRLGEHAWLRENAWDVGEHYAHRVGLKQPNAWGLCDMHGNVWEWCSDWHEEDYYESSPIADPGGALAGSYRVNRGGSFYVTDCRSSNRDGHHPSSRNSNLGFRVARNGSASK